MLFLMCTQLGPSNHVLGGGLDPPGEGEILGCSLLYGLLSNFFDHLLNVGAEEAGL